MDERRASEEANEHVALEINTPWLESIKYRAGMSVRRKPPANPTIFRVPPAMRCGNRDAYEPKLVSIGPYHRGKSEDLKDMEELKWRLLHHYLSKVPNGSKNEGLRKMKDLELRARDCYSEVIDLDSDQFVEMLLLDGCFLVQIFMARDEVSQAELRPPLSDDTPKELSSLLVGNLWFPGLVFRDLLLLENQLPYFIIKHLLDTLRRPGWDSSRLQKAAISSFASFLPRGSDSNLDSELPTQGFQPVYHVLHLFHKWIVSVPKLEEARNTRSCSKLLLPFCLSKLLPFCSNSSPSERHPRFLPSTTELAEAGIKITVRKAKSFLNISFCKDSGVLEIPAINVDDHTNFLFANLIALEQSYNRHGVEVANYTMFLDDIINTPSDVELLHQEGIIHRDLGSNEDVASLFNKLGNGVVYNLKRSHLTDVRQGLNDYCQSI